MVVFFDDRWCEFSTFSRGDMGTQCTSDPLWWIPWSRCAEFSVGRLRQGKAFEAASNLILQRHIGWPVKNPKKKHLWSMDVYGPNRSNRVAPTKNGSFFGYLIMTHEILGLCSNTPKWHVLHPFVALVSVHSWYQGFRSFSHLSIPGKAFNTGFNTIEIPFRKSWIGAGYWYPLAF